MVDKEIRDLKQRNQQLKRLVELSVTLSSTLDLDALLELITGTATELLRCEAASILLYDEKQPRLYFAAATGSDPKKLAEIPVPIEGSLAGTIFRTNHPIIINQPEQDPRHYSLVSEHVHFLVKSLVGVPMLMVLAQPDLGTALTYLPIAIMGLFLGGMKARHAVVILVLGALLAPVGWHVLKPYQRDRLTSFMEPEADKQGSGYQVIQSLIAVGSGGIWGSSAGSQTHLSFLPVPQTDFIFAAFAEEHGFVGALGVMLLYFIVLMRLTQNAQTAPDRAGTFLVMGVVAVLCFHILVNVGMVVGFMPVTGIPLPLMSYGGSSVLFMFLALGIVMNVRMRRFVN